VTREAEGAAAPLSSLREEIDHLFDEFSSSWALSPFRRRGWLRPTAGSSLGWSVRSPEFDVVEKEGEIEIRADVPGIDEKDIEVKLSDGALTVSGERKEERREGEEEGNYYLAERRYGAFQRTIPIPEHIDRDNVEAHFRKGVLTIRLPKTAEAREKSRRIEVKGGD
jgi:HSP20 family protein